MTLVQEPKPTTNPRLVRWAWVFLALTPAGAVLAFLTFAWTADLTHADFLAAGPPGGPDVSLADMLTILIVSGVVGLAAPACALIFAVRAVRAGERRADTARQLAIGTFAVSGALTGLIGLAVWGPVVYLALRRADQ